MTHQYIIQSIVFEDSRNFSIENSASLRTRFSFNINSFIVEFHILQSIYLILSIMADNYIRAGNRHRKNTSIPFKTSRQLAVFSIQIKLFNLSFLDRISGFRLFGFSRVSRTAFLFGLRFSTFTSLFDFLFNQTVDLSIQLLCRLFLFPDFILNSTLLTLQTIQYSLTVFFLFLQLLLFSLTLLQQLLFGRSSGFQFRFLGFYLLLFPFNFYSLQTLIVAIFLHIAHSSVGLSQIFR